MTRKQLIPASSQTTHSSALPFGKTRKVAPRPDVVVPNEQLTLPLEGDDYDTR